MDNLNSVLRESCRDILPDSFVIRLLARDDDEKGFLECLNTLTWTGEIARTRFKEHFDWLQTHSKESYFVPVIEDSKSGKIVATGALTVERKFIWNLGIVGHIEEVSVDKHFQGKGLGKAIIIGLNAIATSVGCAKTILNCDEEHSHFYKKCGYKETGMEMAKYLKGHKDPSEW